MGDTPVDFFVSYTSADRPWAEWVSAELELAGYSTIVQERDMPPGSNFMQDDGGGVEAPAPPKEVRQSRHRSSDASRRFTRA